MNLEETYRIMTLGERIKEIRKDNKLTQKDIAEYEIEDMELYFAYIENLNKEIER